MQAFVSEAKAHLQDLRQAETRAAASAAVEFFVDTCRVRWDKAIAGPVKDRDALPAFCGSPAVLASNCPPDSLPPAADRRDLPAEHWKVHRSVEPDREHVRHRAASHQANHGAA